MAFIFEGLLYPFIFLSIYFQVFMLYNFLSAARSFKREEEKAFDFFPSVAFLLPGWNEGKNIDGTVRSIQDLNYPKDKIKIYYIDNNSSDNTREIVANLKEGDDRIVYIFEAKQGKHHAMNTGIDNAKEELVVCLDVDSTLDKNALAVAASYFKDKEIMSLASCMQIRDVKTFWQRSQVIEYMLSIFWRKAYSAIDAIQVMPGPFSVFRREVFEKLGNYKSAYNAEDFEMTLRMHKNHYKIANAHKAFVYTVGPDTLKGLFKQRVRWIRGFLENAWDYRDMFFKKKYGHFGMFTLPVAASFIFYTLYAVTFTLYKLLDLLYKKLENYIALGVHLPRFDINNFDPFYITTDIFLVQAIFIFTILGIVLFVARDISEDKRPLLINFIVYVVVYPVVASAFVFVSVYQFIFKKKNVWHLQDNKV